MIYLQLITIALVFVVILQRQVRLSVLKELKQSMASQEERLQAALAKLANIQTGVDRIQAELEALKAGNPELEDELAGLEAAVGALDTDVNPPEVPEG